MARSFRWCSAAATQELQAKGSGSFAQVNKAQLNRCVHQRTELKTGRSSTNKETANSKGTRILTQSAQCCDWYKVHNRFHSMCHQTLLTWAVTDDNSSTFWSIHQWENGRFVSSAHGGRWNKPSSRGVDFDPNTLQLMVVDRRRFYNMQYWRNQTGDCLLGLALIA